MKIWLEIDGDGAATLLSWDEFKRDNAEMGDELIEIEAALLNGSYYEGGGGAWLSFVVRPAVSP